MLGAAAELSATIFRDSLQIVVWLFVLFYHDWQLSLVSFVVAPFLALIIRWVERKNRSYGSDFQQSLAELTSVVQEGYRGQKWSKFMTHTSMNKNGL